MFEDPCLSLLIEVYQSFDEREEGRVFKHVLAACSTWAGTISVVLSFIQNRSNLPVH